MHPTVYVLRSQSGRHYFGSTISLDARLEQHARGHTYTTTRGGPWKLIANAVTPSLPEARHLERQFKRWKNPNRVLAWMEYNGVVLTDPG